MRDGGAPLYVHDSDERIIKNFLTALIPSKNSLPEILVDMKINYRHMANLTSWNQSLRDIFSILVSVEPWLLEAILL